VQKPGRVTERAERVQLSFFEADVHPVVEALRGIDVEAMTPLEALTKLAGLQKLVKG
jgi:CRISPR/Cas system-associated endoribonuclease Cas2